MSHAATNWAIRQRGLKPATKIVLWHLADCHNGHTGQCNPRQTTLADLCEMSRSTLNLHLDKLEASGLIRRVVTVDDGTKRQQPTHYVLAMDEAEKAGSESRTRTQDADPPSPDIVEPCPKTGHGSVSEKQTEPCPDFSQSRVRKSDTYIRKNPGKEPGKGTGKAAREDSRILEILSSVISPSVAKDFIDMRRKKRAVMTERAAELIAADLTGHPDPDRVVNLSIKNSWTGIFPDKVGAPRDQSSQQNRQSSADDRFGRIADAAVRNRAPSRPDFGFG